ncbi:MAG: hypothetical protein QME62_13665, partial [Armatimonadota bacterium]|nr:hypothetical protein [Armatimonadota bacterium]
ILESLLGNPEYASAAAEAMGFIRSEAVVPILQNLDREGQPKAVVKSARRALHRLKSEGIVVEEKPEELPGPTLGLTGGRRIIRSIMSNVDGNGEQMLSILFTVPLTGTEALVMIANDVNGIEEFAAVRTTKKAYEDSLAESTPKGSVYVDVPSSYVLFRGREYEAITVNQGKPLPIDYQVYRDLFHAPGSNYERSIIYDEIDAEEIRSNMSLARRAGELFETKIFRGWVIRENDIQPHAVKLIEAEESPLILSKAVKQERIERIFQTAADEIFTPEVRARYKRRIEENAYVLLKTGNPDLARVAVACALELATKDLPSHLVSFVRVLVERSIGVYIATHKDEGRIHRV